MIEVFLLGLLYLIIMCCYAVSISNGSNTYTDIEIIGIALWWPIYLVKFLMKSLWRAIIHW